MQPFATNPVVVILPRNLYVREIITLMITWGAEYRQYAPFYQFNQSSILFSYGLSGKPFSCQEGVDLKRMHARNSTVIEFTANEINKMQSGRTHAAQCCCYCCATATQARIEETRQKKTPRAFVLKLMNSEDSSLPGPSISPTPLLSTSEILLLLLLLGFLRATLALTLAWWQGSSEFSRKNWN